MRAAGAAGSVFTPLNRAGPAREFDAAVYFDTVPELVGRAFNRPRTKTLREKPVAGPASTAALRVRWCLPQHPAAARSSPTAQKHARQRQLAYEELVARKNREKKMKKVRIRPHPAPMPSCIANRARVSQVLDAMQTQRNLLGKGRRRKVMVAHGDTTRAVYKWRKERTK